MAGIEDCYTASAGNTKTLGNTVRATFYALAVSLPLAPRRQERCCAVAAGQGRAGCRGSAWPRIDAVYC
jgi:ribosomal protein S5